MSETVEVPRKLLLRAAGKLAAVAHAGGWDKEADELCTEARALLSARPTAAGAGARDSVAALRGMASNYAGGHCWDHLDGEVVAAAATELATLRAQLAEATERIEDLEYKRDYWKRSSDEKAAAISGIDEHIPAALAAERARCADMAAQWRKSQHVLLHAGEMTAQEMRTALAVAGGIEAAIREGREG